MGRTPLLGHPTLISGFADPGVRCQEIPGWDRYRQRWAERALRLLRIAAKGASEYNVAFLIGFPLYKATRTIVIIKNKCPNCCRWLPGYPIPAKVVAHCSAVLCPTIRLALGDTPSFLDCAIINAPSFFTLAPAQDNLLQITPRITSGKHDLFTPSAHGQ